MIELNDFLEGCGVFFIALVICLSGICIPLFIWTCIYDHQRINDLNARVMHLEYPENRTLNLQPPWQL